MSTIAWDSLVRRIDLIDGKQGDGKFFDHELRTSHASTCQVLSSAPPPPPGHERVVIGGDLQTGIAPIDCKALGEKLEKLVGLTERQRGLRFLLALSQAIVIRKPMNPEDLTKQPSLEEMFVLNALITTTLHLLEVSALSSEPLHAIFARLSFQQETEDTRLYGMAVGIGGAETFRVPNSQAALAIMHRVLGNEATIFGPPPKTI